VLEWGGATCASCCKHSTDVLICQPRWGMKKQLYTIGALCLSLLGPVGRHAVEAAPARSFTIHGGGSGIIAGPAVTLQITGPVKMSVPKNGWKIVGPEQVSSMALVIQQVPTNAIIILGSSTFSQAGHPGGVLGSIPNGYCNVPKCLVSIESRDITWTITFTPAKNIKEFVPDKYYTH
jgi:hypothetical protein